jgi:hypothetical protein
VTRWNRLEAALAMRDALAVIAFVMAVLMLAFALGG